MFKSPSKIITLLQSLLLVVILFPGMYAEVTVILFLLCLARLILKIGNGSFFLELLHIYAAFSCLLMPLLGYKFYNEIKTLILWVRIMPIPAEQYFSFNIPAVVAMGWGFFLFRGSSSDDRPAIQRIVRHLRIDVLAIRPPVILLLTTSAIVAYFISGFLPDSIRQLNTFLYYSLFACAFYIYFYKDFPWKWYLLAGLVGFILLDAFNSGMFTIIAYMSGLILILVIADRKIELYKKLAMLIVGLFLLSFIQLFKLDLRRAYKHGQEANVTELATKVVSSSQETELEALIYPIYQRMNQGYNIALVQKRIPQQVEFLGGEYLGLTFLSAFVPRFVWPDKPEAGGKENMRIYTGIILTTWSTNVGPFGEAYGNFGNVGGWVYIFIFSFFIRAAYTKFLDICKNQPIFFLWLPAIFFQTFYVIETDSLQAFNSLIKGAVFMFLMYKLFPVLFPKRQL
ncbi:MAG: hypothetical protein JNK79_11250 [Chitinophagaceae bacterium]|nr:hypothetical protein [Chitinophagaceae bacterium]